MNEEPTPEEQQALNALRSRGYAVIVWNHDELAGVNPRKVEDRSIELGWDVIEALK